MSDTSSRPVKTHQNGKKKISLATGSIVLVVGAAIVVGLGMYLSRGLTDNDQLSTDAVPTSQVSSDESTQSTQQDNTPAESTTKSNNSTSTSTKSADKSVADSIGLQSTGYSYYGGKYHYGFILNNSQDFTGTVNITLSGVNGSLPGAVVFTENNLKAGAGDVGEVGWSGQYTKYSYAVTIGGNTYNYSGGQILNP